jgi:hypothetical protein
VLDDASTGHASMPRFDHHADTTRLQHIVDNAGDLGGYPLLYLEPPCDSVNDAGELGIPTTRRSGR